MAAGRFDGPTVTLVVNPHAGRGRARRVLPKVCAQLLTGLPDAHLRVHQTTSYADARLRTITAVENARPTVDGEPADTLVVVGGDGMAHLGINACARTPVHLGVIPAGTGNDFCRGVGIPTNVAAATKVIVEGHTRRIDAIEARGRLAGGAQIRHVGSVVSTGYDARVNARANEMSLRLGPLAYAYVALAELARFEPMHYLLTIDGEVREIPAMFVAVGNAGYFGGGMRICPDADPADGQLDVTIVHPVSRATLLRLLPTTYSGAFARDPAVEQLRATRVVVDGYAEDGPMYAMADGEALGDVPVDLRVIQGALSVLTPRTTHTS